MQASVSSERCLYQMSSWIEECKLHHPACRSEGNNTMPTRLLSISWSLGHPKIHLEVLDQTKRKRYDYVALSHVWKLTSPLRTTNSNLDGHRKDIPYRTLSTALQDTVILALSLGYSFVWIDSLCIIQDSIEDWEVECPRMASIYKNASVVFAAHSSNLGLERLNIIQAHAPAYDVPIYARFYNCHHDVIKTNRPSSQPHSNTLFSRAWCMQERLFARRTILFGGASGEVAFECSTKTDCQCGWLGNLGEDSRSSWTFRLRCRLPRALGNLEIDPQNKEHLRDLYRIYLEVVESYTGMELSYETDTLPAISSVMASLAPYFGNYYAGLWEHNFIASLAWQAVEPRNCIRQQKYIGPSFSWASIQGKVHWPLTTFQWLPEKKRVLHTYLASSVAVTSLGQY